MNYFDLSVAFYASYLLKLYFTLMSAPLAQRAGSISRLKQVPPKVLQTISQVRHVQCETVVL